jgi:hypothetical protein
VDIHALNDQAFARACEQGHLDLARWLCALEPEWPWLASGMRALRTWSPARDVWMRAASTCNVWQ